MGSLEEFLLTPEGRELQCEMMEDLAQYNRIMLDTKQRTREAIDAYLLNLMHPTLVLN